MPKLGATVRRRPRRTVTHPSDLKSTFQLHPEPTYPAGTGQHHTDSVTGPPTGYHLHPVRRLGGTGRRDGLKNRCPKGRVGSSPTVGTPSPPPCASAGSREPLGVGHPWGRFGGDPFWACPAACRGSRRWVLRWGRTAESRWGLGIRSAGLGAESWFTPVACTRAVMTSTATICLVEHSAVLDRGQVPCRAGFSTLTSSMSRMMSGMSGMSRSEW